MWERELKVYIVSSINNTLTNLHGPPDGVCQSVVAKQGSALRLNSLKTGSVDSDMVGMQELVVIGKAQNTGCKLTFEIRNASSSYRPSLILPVSSELVESSIMIDSSYSPQKRYLYFSIAYESLYYSQVPFEIDAICWKPNFG